MQYSNEYTENIHSYVNNINTVDGGTHLSGFRTALTRTLNTYGKKENLFKDLVPTGDDFREGLTAIVSVRVPEPQFEAQTKIKLNNPEVEGIVNSLPSASSSSKYLEENPKTAKSDRQQRPFWPPRPAKRPARPRNCCANARAAFRRRPARQAPRLHQQGRRTLRAVPGRR